jgi:hypothetical protein
MTASPIRLLAGAALLLALAWLPSLDPARAQGFDDRTTGFLTAKTGGLPADSWRGTSLATAKRLVSALSAAPRSRALRDLQFTVMVSALTPPAPDGSPPPTLFARKVEKLAAMGEAESLNEMVRGAGGYSDPTIAAAVVNAMMLAGEHDGACAIVRGYPLPEPFGRRASVACRLVASDGAGAQAEVAAVRAADPGFGKLVDTIAGGQPPNGATPALLDGPAMVLLGLAYVVPPAAALRTTQPSLIRSIVAQKIIPLPIRIEVAERGEALAIIEATRLADLYVEAVAGRVPLPPATAQRARLVAAARAVTNAQEIMNSMTAVYGEARGGALFPTVARATAAGMLNLPAKPEYAAVAPDAMRGFFLLGDKRLATAWTHLAVNNALNNPRALAALDRLMPMAAVAGIDDPKQIPPSEINRWYDAMRQDDPQRAPLRGYLLLELLRATGIDVPPRSTNLPESAPGGVRLVMPPAATLQALQAAGQGRRRAEAALLASVAIGETPLNELHPAAVGAIVRALREVGEDAPARQFAIEIAIAQGL